ncbi:hypothetical protein [Variovorax sp. YR216]|uniref:hypothetical protein n=1 Tax=Variovorax sp. YR216 TaxID=1882828 RepID=UPI0008969D1B|nr:hypothetical protein [Variovorax sp. YR216]SEB24835.1 hypothetical protein SAMN05444680_12224 [Variovorax sp. YR216]
MNPLQFELDRLYGLGANPADCAAPAAAQGVRALVLELRPPAGWAQLSSVWTGVQVDLGFPPPAIAVSGVDALQLWFSLASPTSPRAGELFLQGLRARYLPDVGSTHVRLIADAAQLPSVPPLETSPDRWSAFVAPDLASVFADTPWLDLPPNAEGQASLLHALEPIRQVALEAALSQLGVVEEVPADLKLSGLPEVPSPEQGGADAERFLRRVMNDESVPMALRIEAAKGLLGHAKRS